MLISKKNQYALRAVFEPAKHHGNGPFIISRIAEIQAIQERFLEIIHWQLKKTGFAQSKRGYQGGCFTSIQDLLNNDMGNGVYSLSP